VWDWSRSQTPPTTKRRLAVADDATTSGSSLESPAPALARVHEPHAALAGRA